jgi:hypothetical protein
MTDERELVAALQFALAPVPVHWGFAPLETMSEPPSLPLVVVQRLTYSTEAYEDQCEGPYVGNTVLVIDAWAIHYEAARALASDVREAADAAGGWRMQSETDLYEPNLRAWRIQGQWLAGGVPPL